MNELKGVTRNRAATRALLRSALAAGKSRQEAVREAIDEGCPWDTIHRELALLERAGLCEPRRVLPTGARRLREV